MARPFHYTNRAMPHSPRIKGGPCALSAASPPGVVGSRGEQPNAPTILEGAFGLRLHNGGSPTSRQHDANNINQIRNSLHPVPSSLNILAGKLPSQGCHAMGRPSSPNRDIQGAAQIGLASIQDLCTCFFSSL
jgi:hypothetical protein